MRRRTRFLLACTIALAATPAWSLVGLAAKAAPAQVVGVTLLIHHRAFPDFFDADSVGLRQEFQVGDTPYSARIVEYLPDFAMDLKTRRFFTRSPEPRNPGFRIIVREKGVPQDTVWAFLNMPPHFARKSLLAFQVGRIDFKNRAPMMAGDSTASRVPRPQAARPDSGRAPAPHVAPVARDSAATKARKP